MFDLVVTIGTAAPRRGERAYLDPPVMSTLRPLREYGIFGTLLAILGEFDELLIAYMVSQASNPTYM